jgi:hypothetical protein
MTTMVAAPMKRTLRISVEDYNTLGIPGSGSEVRSLGFGFAVN